MEYRKLLDTNTSTESWNVKRAQVNDIVKRYNEWLQERDAIVSFAKMVKVEAQISDYEVVDDIIRDLENI